MKGYSLIELLIVIVIASLIVSSTIYGFKNYRERAEELGGEKRSSELQQIMDMDLRK